MGARNPNGLQKRGRIIGKEFGGIDAIGFVGFARTARIDRDASEVLGVLGDLKCIAGAQYLRQLSSAHRVVDAAELGNLRDGLVNNNRFWHFRQPF